MNLSGLAWLNAMGPLTELQAMPEIFETLPSVNQILKCKDTEILGTKSSLLGTDAALGEDLDRSRTAGIRLYICGAWSE